jgi:hypothetical protein
MLSAIRLHESASLLVFTAQVLEELREGTVAITCSLFSGPPRRPDPNDPALLAYDRTLMLPLDPRLCRLAQSILDPVILRETVAAHEAGLSPKIAVDDEMSLGDLFAAMERIPLTVFPLPLGDTPETKVYLIRSEAMNDFLAAGLASFLRS